ncbi:patatin-like phospholipase family protein [Aminipila terrae]
MFRGGVLGISYIGMLEYLYKIQFIKNVKRVAGSSAGAIAACITSFNLPFDQTKTMAESLDYSKVPATKSFDEPKNFTKAERNQLDRVFGNIDCVYRLIKKYGWYSSSYFYDWIRYQIAGQFDPFKKNPPYTFADFRNSDLHRDGREFKELYIIGTDISTKTSTVFSAADTPHVEVAQAIRISMSVPIFFEAIKSDYSKTDGEEKPKVYADGGIMYRYPITLFDETLPKDQTLGGFLAGDNKNVEINNLLDYISNLISCSAAVQTQFSYGSPENMNRSIQIFTDGISALDFNVKKGDDTYNFLYEQGYKATENYFNALFSS